ncbi:uncharacterized protein TRAVEDRAFT_42472 [Trametes versicolor FP-101664 SS1]|uniref:uncharacterized protein n=1 Tax=Trametes versicolor (strain FP-101664) TaxID=717944 RepID=UPI0004623827|nr:uncharacterized protein TRAVEDRAFT_42472 [Trametes versicolor FP-101664 SS1]EIW65078.1 hypothetical protein TRAVEDRAFT_42472 [Trametes versicolor FP-101664 SS1]
MSILRLPDEVCEEIIDNCRSFLDGGDWAPEESYQVLLACSLTCQAWLPRSRLRLYSALLFRHHRDVGSLLETVTAHPFLADLPRTMCIHSTQEYIPFASSNSVLAQKLPNIRTMWLVVNWKHYPTKHHAVIGQYPVVQLYIDFQPIDTNNFHRLFHLVYSLPNLRQLHRAPTLHGRIMKPTSLCPPISDADVLRTTLLPVQPRRRTIVLLALEASWFDIGNTPLAEIFGTSVVELTIRCLTTRSPTYRHDLQRLLTYLSLLSSLKTLSLIVEPRNLHGDVLSSSENATVFYPWIASAISSARTHTTLRVVRLRFWGPECVWTCASLSRHGFLDMLATRALEDALCNIPNLSQLALELPAGPGDSPDVCRWWETELRKRFLRLNAQISAAVHARSGISSQPHACRPIWIDAREETPDAHQILPLVRYPNYNVRAHILESELIVVYDYVPLTEALEWRGVSQPDELTFPLFADVGKKLGIVVAPAELQLPRQEPLVKLYYVRGWATGGQGVVPITRAELAYLVSAELRALMQAYPLVRGGTAIEFARLCLIEVHQVTDDTLQALFGIIPNPSGRPLTAD